MKKLLAVILFTAISQKALATEWFSYFAYVQTEYHQGPWIRMPFLEKSEGKYLEPKRFEDLLSISGDGQDLANAILSRLKKETPARYKFNYTLSISGDTAVIKTNDVIKDVEAVTNELTASFTSNGFAAVRITQGEKTVITMRHDLTVPFMDLIHARPSSVLPQENCKPTESSDSNLFTYLILSLTVNLLLIFVLIKRKK